MRKNLLSRAALAVLSMGFVSSAMAANINVSNVADLKTAVGNAASGDVIILAAGNYLLDSEIDVSGKNLTFVGEGKVVLDGQKTVRVMNVHANANATVENLIIQNGYVSDGGNNKGAGIRVDGGSLTVTNCKFIDNKVDYKASNGNWTGGGGIHSFNAKLTITNSEFTGCEAYQGGAITLQNSSIDAKHVLFIGNRTMFYERKTDAKGGAICVRSDAAPVTHNYDNCVFKENVSWGNGGAISNNVGGGSQGQNTTFRGCSFVRNTTNIDLDNIERNADNRDLNGGALYFEGDGNVKMNFLSCTFTQNWTVKCGGAADFESFKAKPDNELRFVNCTITGNHNLDNTGNGAGLTFNAINTCKGLKIYNTILTGNWSIKVNDETYAADEAEGNGWKHWEYSDLSTGKESNQSLFDIKNTVIGYLNNADKYEDGVNIENFVIKHPEGQQAWIEGDTEEGQLGELGSFDEDYFAYAFNISAIDWMEMGNAALAAEFDCPTDQFGIEWESDCIGATQYDDIEYYDVPTFFDEAYVPTGIANIKNETVTGAENNAWYTVSGVRVAEPTAKGIYIHNGKKVVK